MAATDDFERNRDSPPLAHSQPRFSGALSWVRGIKERLNIGFQGIQQFPQSILKSAQAREVAQEYAKLLLTLGQYELECLQTWEKETVMAGLSTLKQPLLR